VQTRVVQLIRKALRPLARSGTGAVAKQLKTVCTGAESFADPDSGLAYS
jgi:hypothetical protein